VICSPGIPLTLRWCARCRGCQGFATEAAGAVVQIVGLYRIWATCHVDDVAPARVLATKALLSAFTSADENRVR
jgi:hypothetical protein